jgi:hypothetical protein
MDEPVKVTCHRCSREFTTRASARTTCRYCRCAVSVRRDRDAACRIEIDGAEVPVGLGGVVGLLFVVGWWIWRVWGSKAADT